MSRRFTVLDSSMSKEQRRRIAIQELMRGDTQAIRNWGYPQQIMRVTTKLFFPLDEDIRAFTGARVTDLVGMLSKVSDVIEDRMNSHLELLRPMMLAKTVPCAVEEYYHAFPDIRSGPEELVQLFEKQNPELDQVKLMLISHGDLRLPDIFTVTLDDFVDAYPKMVEPEVLQKILDAWSLAFGELANQDPEHFFMGNPVWVRPFIYLDKGLFFWPIPSMFLRISEKISFPNYGGAGTAR